MSGGLCDACLLSICCLTVVGVIVANQDYLETKRLVFPRFYFLSNEELLDILAQSKNPDAVQVSVSGCVQTIDRTTCV